MALPGIGPELDAEPGNCRRNQVVSNLARRSLSSRAGASSRLAAAVWAPFLPDAPAVPHTASTLPGSAPLLVLQVRLFGYGEALNRLARPATQRTAIHDARIASTRSDTIGEFGTSASRGDYRPRLTHC